MSNSIIKSICECLGILVGDGKQNISSFSSKRKADAFIGQLKNNVDLVFTEIALHPELEHLLSGYFKKQLLHNGTLMQGGYWNFLEWCLILIELLRVSLSKCFIQKETEILANSDRVFLSISQQKIVEKCLQFIIALGFLPNLLPRVGQPLNERSEFADIVECLEEGVLPQTKHRRLVTCVKILLSCTTEVTLQSIILTRHAGDILAALFQLGYAPIKKIHDYEPYPIGLKEDRCSSLHLTSFENVKHPSYEVNVMALLANVRDESSMSDIELIHEMWQDRKHFLPCLNYLLKTICVPIVMWELLLLGSPRKHLNDGHTKMKKAPSWLTKICNNLLNKKLSEPHGLKSFVHVMLDKVSDEGPNERRIFDRRKIDAVARLVSEILVNKDVMEYFIQNISGQVIDLLHTRESKVDPVFGSVASVIILQLAENHPILSEKYFFQNIFKAFWKCLDRESINKYEENVTIANEEDLSVCIEDAYQIFVENESACSPNCNQLLPFFHLLFQIYSEVQNGVSYLRPKIFSLLLTIINRVDVEEAVDLMNLVCFEDLSTKSVLFAVGLRCISGKTGGISVVHSVRESPEDKLNSITRKFQAANAVLSEASQNDLKMSFFLNLLKRLKDVIRIEKGKDVDFQNSYVMLHLLQELVEVIGEELVKKATDIICFVKEFLDHGIEASSVENCDQLFGSETLVFALIILDTFIGYKNQLSSLDWKTIKQCIPCLRLLSENSDDSVREMSQNLLIAIATHGSVDFNNQKILASLQCTDSSDKRGIDESCRKKHHIQKSPSDEKREKCTVEELSSYPKNIENLCSSDEEIKGNIFLPSAKDFSTPCKYINYQTAIRELKDPILPVRGHGLICLTRLIVKRDEETLSHEKELLEIFQENIADDDSYIYLAAIQGLSALADVSTASVLSILLDLFINVEDHKWQLQLKIGEVLVKVSRNLGEMTVKHQNELINAFLHGIKNKNAEIRMSSFSNLAEVCQQLKWSIQSMFYEILQCIDCVLKTDKDVGVRRSAAIVLTSMLKGMGKDNLLVMSGFMKELFSVIRNVYHTDKDEIVQLHAQIALEEIRSIIRKLTSRNNSLVKEIRILDPS